MKTQSRVRRKGGKNPSPFQPKIYIATASHGQQYDLIHLQSMLALYARPPVTISLGWSCGPSLDFARNELTRRFLKSDCTHLLFIGPDIGFTIDDFKRIISHPAGFVSALCPLKTTDRAVAWCGKNVDKHSLPEDGLQEVNFTGANFLCLKRSVVTKIVNEYPCPWTETVRKGVHITSEENCCLLWKRLGGRVYCDTKVIVKRAGRAVWPLPIQEGNPLNAVKQAA